MRYALHLSPFADAFGLLDREALGLQGLDEGAGIEEGGAHGNVSGIGRRGTGPGSRFSATKTPAGAGVDFTA
jgi:hypothetical protein